MLSRRRQPRGAWTALVALALAACASTGGSGQPTSVAAVARELADQAEMRASPRGMRICVHAIGEAAPENLGVHQVTYYRMGERKPTIGPELERELLVALSRRFHLVEPDAAVPPTSPTGQADLKAYAVRYGVTHVVVGDYVVREDDILLSLRLVDVEDGLIIAAANGAVPLDELSDYARVVLGDDEIGELVLVDPEPLPDLLPAPLPATPVETAPPNALASAAPSGAESANADGSTLVARADEPLERVVAPTRRLRPRPKPIRLGPRSRVSAMPTGSGLGPAAARLAALGRSVPEVD